LKLGRTIDLAPSILSADFTKLADEIKKIESSGADVVHLDIMDGHFVPNITIGPPVVASIRKITRLPLDVHLMIKHPENFLDAFINAGANWISVHIEADAHIDRTLNYLKDKGIRAGIAVNPGTPLSLLEEAIHIADYILLMTVNPGFGGQKFIPSMLKKIGRLRDFIVLNSFDARIEVDGGIGPDNMDEVLTAGADVIVVGSAIFNSKIDAAKAVRELKDVASKHMQYTKKA
jgi:ribulose-phosphate 3-epimerase